MTQVCVPQVLKYVWWILTITVYPRNGNIPQCSTYQSLNMATPRSDQYTNNGPTLASGLCD